MNTSLITLALVVAAVTTACAGESAASKPATRKPAATVAAKKPFYSDREWRHAWDRPCDSSACRPQRFAWAPIAPGA